MTDYVLWAMATACQMLSSDGDASDGLRLRLRLQELAKGYIDLEARFAQREEGVANLQKLLANAYENNAAAYRERDALSDNLAEAQAERGRFVQKIDALETALAIDLRWTVGPEQIRGEVVPACQQLISKWRDAARQADRLARESDARFDGANSHAFRKERRIWTTCANELEAYWQCVNKP